MILGTNGIPLPERKRNKCIFFDCGIDVEGASLLCPEHHADVPFHLREAMKKEIQWLNEQHSPADEHLVSLLNVCVNRAMQHKALKDPDFRQKLAKALADFETKNPRPAAPQVQP